MEVFVHFVGRLRNKRKAEWKSGVLGQLGGATPTADGRTFFITDGVTAALFCTVSTLDIQL